MTFKPKKQQIHVPGCGVVQKEDFTQDHFDILMKRADRVGRDEFIKQHFVVESYGDQPLFVEVPAPGPKGKGKPAKVTAPKPEKSDDEILDELIEKEKENGSESAN